MNIRGGLREASAPDWRFGKTEADQLAIREPSRSGNLFVRRRCPVAHEVCDEQRKRETDQAEDEVADEAVSLAPSNASGPERQGYPDDEKRDTQKHPAEG